MRTGSVIGVSDARWFARSTMMIERVEKRSRRERRQLRICRCRAASSLRTAGLTIPVLKPVQHRHLEIRQAPTLAERQKRAAAATGTTETPGTLWIN